MLVTQIRKTPQQHEKVEDNVLFIIKRFYIAIPQTGLNARDLTALDSKKIDVPPRLRPSAGVGRKRKPCKQSFLSTRPDDCRMFEKL